MQLNSMLFLYFVIFFVLGYLLFSAMYAAVGAISNSDQEAQNASFPITLSLIVPIVLFSYVVKDPNSTLAFTLSQIPFFSPIIMFARVNLANPPMWQVLLSIGILMYGKRPTLPELLKWIKY